MKTRYRYDLEILADDGNNIARLDDISNILNDHCVGTSPIKEYDLLPILAGSINPANTIKLFINDDDENKSDRAIHALYVGFQGAFYLHLHVLDANDNRIKTYQFNACSITHVCLNHGFSADETDALIKTVTVSYNEMDMVLHV